MISGFENSQDRAKRYEKICLIADTFFWFCEIAAILFLVFSGLSLFLRQWIDVNLTEMKPAVLVFYILILGMVGEVISFAPRYWRSYVLPKRFGMVTQSPRDWFKDHVKAKILSFVFSIFILEIIFLLLDHSPDNWWIWAGIIISLLMVVLAQLAPILIFPLFFKFLPLEDEDLKNRLLALAQKAGVRLEKIYEVNLSSKTKAANAALAGLGKTRRILLGDTLLRNFSKDEIEGVIAHELGHYVHSHLWKRIAIQVGVIFLYLWMIHFSTGYFADNLGYTGRSDVAALPLMALTAALAALVVLPPINYLMRKYERQADRYALEATGKPWALIGTFERLARVNLANRKPNRVIEALFYSHPSIDRRIELCRGWAGDLCLPLVAQVVISEGEKNNPEEKSKGDDHDE